MDGIIVVNKEKGYTSHDIVAIIRKELQIKKVGHTGTLDPNATGVLPILLGEGTKLSQYLTDHDKEYEAILELGTQTDTGDVEGKVINQDLNIKEFDKIKILQVLQSCIGEMEQLPPMYSAIKVKGKKLYEYAREGKKVEIPVRKIKIYDIQLLEYSKNLIKFHVSCSKGTYIRTLCHDIGKKLGVCATMEKLMRTRVSVFKIEDALTLNDIEILSKEKPEIFREKVYSVDSLFDYSKVNVAGDGIRYLQNGNTLKAKDFKQDVSGIKQDEKILVYDENNNFKAVYQKNENDFKVFNMF